MDSEKYEALPDYAKGSVFAVIRFWLIRKLAGRMRVGLNLFVGDHGYAFWFEDGDDALIVNCRLTVEEPIRAFTNIDPTDGTLVGESDEA